MIAEIGGKGKGREEGIREKMMVAKKERGRGKEGRKG